MIGIFVGEGKLMAEPELKYSPEGKPRAMFRMVFSDSRKLEDGSYDPKNKADFVDIVVFGHAAEHLAESDLTKGDLLVVQGRRYTHKFEKDDGTTAYYQRIVADSVGVSVRFGAVRVHRDSRGRQPAAVVDDWE